jgi:hypothetical protein
MFLIDIPFKGCQGRSNRSSILHAFLFVFAYHRCFAYDFHFSKLFEIFLCAYGVNDSACIVHAVSMTPHAFQKIRISSRIQIYIRKGFIPLIRSPGRMF